MGDCTEIEWSEATHNPLIAFDIETGKRGWFCVHKSDGCANCYAETMNVWRGNGLEYTAPNLKKIRFEVCRDGQTQSSLDWPLRVKRPRRIFPCSMTDLFGEWVGFEIIGEYFAMMALAHWHTFQILTKRVDRAREYLSACNAMLPHVWIGASVENDREAKSRREDLRAIAEMGWFTWVSYEPALGPVDWRGWEFIRWLVAGGESGGVKARPSHLDWFRDARDFCVIHDKPYFFKQRGEWISKPEIAEWRQGERGWGWYETAEWAEKLKAVKGKKRFGALNRSGEWFPDATTWNGHQYDPDHDYECTMLKLGKKATGAVLDRREWREYPP